MFRKRPNLQYLINSLLVGLATLAAARLIDRLPDRRPSPPATVPLAVEVVSPGEIAGPLRPAGAWQLTAADPRFGGLSALAIDRGRFVAVTDRGAALWFDRPEAARPAVEIKDLREGPGPFARKSARDAESMVADPRHRGWWVGYEQRHSLWLYDPDFRRPLRHIDLPTAGWARNRGAEGLLANDDRLVAFGESGRDAVRIGAGAVQRLAMPFNAEVADAATAPDGSQYVLLRRKGVTGIRQAIAMLQSTRRGYRLGPAWALPGSGFDNFEGMAIEARPGGWRFWLVTDNGHRIFARTLLVALDLPITARHTKARR